MKLIGKQVIDIIKKNRNEKTGTFSGIFVIEKELNIEEIEDILGYVYKKEMENGLGGILLSTVTKDKEKRDRLDNHDYINVETLSEDISNNESIPQRPLVNDSYEVRGLLTFKPKNIVFTGVSEGRELVELTNCILIGFPTIGFVTKIKSECINEVKNMNLKNTEYHTQMDISVPFFELKGNL